MATTNPFRKATRKQARLRLGISGPSNAGKTTAALNIATGLGGRIALIDTERSSASLYSDEFTFDAMDLNAPYAPERFIKAIRDAEENGYDTCIIDSSTHEWNGSGGCCEINDMLAQAKYRGNSWSAWSETTPRHRAFIDAMLQSPMHIIATMRSKTETVQGDDKKVRKVGMKDEQRDGVEYEFTVKFELEHSTHLAIATKDRTRLFKDPALITPETGERLLAWLNSGVTQRMTEGELADHRAAIGAASNADELRLVYAAAYRAAKNITDTAAMAAIEKAYSERKQSVAA
jgi:hypothetical protein